MSTDETTLTTPSHPAPAAGVSTLASPVPLGPVRSQRLLVLSISLGTILNPINSSMLAVALVPIARSYHASIVSASWLISALYITTAIAQPTWGRIADRHGPRVVLLSGGALVAIAGGLAPFAPSLGWLILARVLIGAGTASGYPAALAVVRRMSLAQEGVIPSTTLGVVSVTAQVTNAIGPPLGGLLIELGSWHWIFWFNVPFVACVLALGFFTLPREPRGRRSELSLLAEIRSLDPPGLLLFALATGLGVAALINVESLPLLAAAFAVGALLSGALFLRWERRTAFPFIPQRLFKGSGGLRQTYARIMFTNTVFYAIYYGWPVWLEQGRGLSPGTTGLVTLPIAVIGAFGAAGATAWSSRRGPRPIVIAGALLLVVGCASLMTVSRDTPVIVLVAIAMLLGLPNGLTSVGNQLAGFRQAPDEHAGVAAGLQRTSSYLGANIASALVGLTVAQGTAGSMHVLAGALVAIALGLTITALHSRALSELRPLPAVADSA